ncbi:MAG TPA: hypothetical protein VGH86_10860 [Phenylobacterium sp.]|jgi:hypothetical protein
MPGRIATAHDQAAGLVPRHAADAAPLRHHLGDLVLAIEKMDAAIQDITEIEALFIDPERRFDQTKAGGNFLHRGLQCPQHG